MPHSLVKMGEIIDFASGIGVSSVGHGNRRLNDAVCEQVRNIFTSQTYR